ncbi:MAG: hydrolase [Cycloclasticus sp. symbiont of Bathymodiolus heckerae]|nr:MAG: hydrolase [Cycloclasticus sp. symbiont of Bathymodiolus heckerae]
MISDYDLIVFDWDGTLVDSIDWIVDCIQYVAKVEELPKPTEQACKDIIGLSLSNAMLVLFPDITEVTKASMVASYRTRYLSKNTSGGDLFTGVIPVLQMIKEQGKLLAVATGKGQSGLDRGLDGTGIRSFFDYLRCAENMQSKPSPHMLFDIMEESNIEPARTLMVGDSTLDLIMANKAGVASIGVTTGAHSYEKLMQEAPLACISNLVELIKR